MPEGHVIDARNLTLGDSVVFVGETALLVFAADWPVQFPEASR